MSVGATDKEEKISSFSNNAVLVPMFSHREISLVGGLFVMPSLGKVFYLLLVVY
jgi:hypothetical protein